MNRIESITEKFRSQLGDLAPRVTLSTHRRETPMDLEELQNALDLFDKWGSVNPDNQQVIVEAARLVADGTRALVVASLWIEGERQLVLVLENDIDPAEGTPFHLIDLPGHIDA